MSKPDRINYQKTFNLGNYCSERIGMEAQLDEGEDVGSALLELKRKVENFHIASNPRELTDAEPIKWDRHEEPYQSVYANDSSGTVAFPQQRTIPSIDYKAKEEIEDAIANATSIESLAKVKEDAGKYGLATQYMDKLNQLT